MYTDRIVRATVLALALICVLAGSSTAEILRVRSAFEAWKGQERPVLFVLCVDGLRPDRVQADLPWDETALMPHVRRWASEAVVFENVLSDRTGAVEGFEILRASVAPLLHEDWATDGVIAPSDLRSTVSSSGADPAWHSVQVLVGDVGAGRCVAEKNVTWMLGEERAVEAALARAGKASGPVVLLAVVDHLLLPYVLADEELSVTDPEPWDSRLLSKDRIEVLGQRRLARARRESGRRLPQHSARSGGSVDSDAAWANDAAHRRFDQWFGRLLERIEELGLAERAAILLTATSSSGRGDRAFSGSGVGARLDVARIPLMLRLPEATPHVDRDPRLLSDIATLWTVAPGLFEEAERGRHRWSFADARGERGERWVESRWTTSDFTLIDIVEPLTGRRLYDLRRDPQERVDRSFDFPALADSLQSVARQSIYGDRPRVRIRVEGLDGKTVVIESSSRLQAEGSASSSRRVTWTVDRGELVLTAAAGMGSLRIQTGADADLWVGEKLFSRGRAFDLPLHGRELLSALDAGDSSGTPRTLTIELRAAE